MGHSLLALENRLHAEEPSTASQQHHHHQQPATVLDKAKEDPRGTEELTTRMINFIIDRPLGLEERQLIYELTLKKRQSKKSTMSEKQLLAKQQLAKELKLERRDPIDIDSIRYAALNTTLNRSYSMNLDDLFDRTSSASSFNDKESICGSKLHQPKLTTNNTSTTGSWGAYGGSSFSESDRSYEADSTSGQLLEQSEEFDRPQTNELETGNRTKEATIRLKRSRLEQMNAELETRLYQYEYLVAQEKALLGNYNMMLFTNKGVNNFNLTQDTL